MKKKLQISYQVLTDDGHAVDETKQVTVPEKPPVCFFAGAQPLVDILHLEKVAMAEYIKQLEDQLEAVK